MSENRSKTVVIIALCLTLIFMGVGFAALSQQLNITTNGEIIASSWDIHFEEFATGAKVLSGDTTKVTASATGDNSNAVVLTFALEKPGDTVEFTGKVVNKGSIPATLKDAVVDTFDGRNLIEKTVEVMPQQGSGLAATNGQADIKITYKFIETVNEVPSAKEVFSDTITLNYVQAD